MHKFLSLTLLATTAALPGCAAFLPSAYTPVGPDLAAAPPEVHNDTTCRPLTDNSQPGKDLKDPTKACSITTSAFSYVQQVSDELERQAGQVNGVRQGFAYAGTAAGLGTAAAAAATAVQGVTLGFGAASAALTGVDTAAGLDSRSQVLSKAITAIACLREAEVLLATPVNTGPGNLVQADFVLGDMKPLLEPFTQQLIQATTDNTKFATGTDGVLPWFLVIQAWNIWDTSQQQLQSAAGNLKDVLAAVKSGISNASQQPKGSPGQVAAASATLQLRASSMVAYRSMLANRAAGKEQTPLAPMITGVQLLTATATDPGTTAADLYQKLQQAVQKCPTQTAATPAPKGNGGTTTSPANPTATPDTNPGSSPAPGTVVPIPQPAQPNLLLIPRTQ